MKTTSNHTFTHDLSGAPLPLIASCSLHWEESALTLQATVSNELKSAPGAQPHTFTAELWKHDVIELFLANASGRYLEINLAPNTAWWAQWFSTARCADHSLPVPKCVVTEESSPHEDTRALSLSIAFSDLAPLGERESIRWNATYICHSPDQRYASIAHLPGDTPDFHQPDQFLPVSQS